MCGPLHHITSSLAQFSTFKHDDLSALKTFMVPGRHPPGQRPTRPIACWDTPLPHCMLGYTAPVPLHVGIYTLRLWTEGMTHACENITFPQLDIDLDLLLRAVNIDP